MLFKPVDIGIRTKDLGVHLPNNYPVLWFNVHPTSSSDISVVNYSVYI